MARYAHLYSETLSSLQKAEAALVKAREERELYRAFIADNGHIQDFILWWGKRSGFSDDHLSSVRDAFSAAKAVE